MPNENKISRRGLFMKIGNSFQWTRCDGSCRADRTVSLVLGYAGTRRGIPFLGASRSCQRISRRRDAPGYFPESLRDADRRQDSGHGLLGAAD